MAQHPPLPLPRRLVRFFQHESTGGIIMILSALLALIAANGATADLYRSFIELPIGIAAGMQDFSLTLGDWVKDVLMVFFFLLIGMELKREMVEGVLADKKQILLPLVAAIGGMAAPALVFLLVNAGVAEHANGWAIPSATDIAFALCVLTLIGKSVPSSLKIFLLAVAIFDDLGAILIIAFFYSHGVGIASLLACALVAGLLFLLNRSGIMAVTPYILLGVVLWFCLHAAGIHTTLAGVITGLAIPLRNPRDRSESPLSRCMHSLHPWVSFFVLPVFAFTSSGVNLEGVSLESLLAPLPLGIALGLFLGKQLGIFGISFIVIRLGFATLPPHVSWRQMYGVSVIAGIGFTMSLFIGALAFSGDALQEQVKLGVITGSLLAALFGWLMLRR